MSETDGQDNTKTEGNDEGGDQDKSQDQDVDKNDQSDKKTDQSDKTDTSDKKTTEPDKKDGEGDKGKESETPEKYDLKLPEGSQLDAEAVDRVAEFAKTNKLTQEQAQAILDAQSKEQAGYVERQQKEIENLKSEWLEEAKRDKEVGGEKLKENAELATRFVEKFGSKELKEFLENTGYGQNVEVIRMLSKAQKQFENDSFVHGKDMGGGQKKSTAEVLYGESMS